jgi:hypothetical protein
VTETTIKGRYRYGLSKFIDWAIDKKLYPGPRPTFVCIDPENLAALPRDAFEDAELLELLRLPLFTGCAGPHRIWSPGRYWPLLRPEPFVLGLSDPDSDGHEAR